MVRGRHRPEPGDDTDPSHFNSTDATTVSDLGMVSADRSSSLGSQDVLSILSPRTDATTEGSTSLE